MSKKSITQQFVPVYRELMMIPDYVKCFQSKSIGSMYTIIVSRVWRKGYAWTKGEGYYGNIEQSSREYDAGNLCAHIKDEELASLLDVNIRHVRRMRKQLEDLGLVEAKKADYHSTGNYYRVGTVSNPGEYGNNGEVLYIEKWLNEVEEQKFSLGKVVPEKLEFVNKIKDILDYSKPKKKKKISPNLAMGVSLFGHGQPDTSQKPQREVASETRKLELKDKPYNNKNIKRTTSSSTEVAVQGQMFEQTVDLSYIDESISPSSLGQALVREHGRVGNEKLKPYLLDLLKKNNIHMDPAMKQKMFYATFVDIWFKRFQPKSKTMSTPIMVWWKALSLDLERPDLIRDAKKNMIIISKIEGVNNWFEFSFLVKELFNNNGGLPFFQSFKHITWLQNSLMKEVYKLGEFRSNVNISSLKDAKPIDTDALQRELDERLDQAMREIDEEESDEDIDVDDLLRL